jgi:hypothetical protein
MKRKQYALNSHTPYFHFNIGTKTIFYSPKEEEVLFKEFVKYIS